MQGLGQQQTVLNIVNPGNWRRGVITSRTIVENRLNVLEQNIIEESHKMITNVTSSPLLLGARCVASQNWAGSPVATQNASRCRASSLKSWRRGVRVVVVIFSSRPWWSTKIQLSKDVFMVNNLTYKKKETLPRGLYQYT